MAHSPLNMLKAATPHMGAFMKVLPAFHTYLTSQSVHRWHKYIKFSNSLGLRVGFVPKMLDVWFCIIVNLANWVLKDDHSVYGFINELARNVKDGTIKEPGCADGRKQQLYIEKEDASALTILIEALVLSCIINTKEGRDVATVDVPGAFMQADMDEKVHIKLEGRWPPC